MDNKRLLTDEEISVAIIKATPYPSTQLAQRKVVAKAKHDLTASVYEEKIRGIFHWFDSKKEGIYSESQGMVIKFSMLHTEWVKEYKSRMGVSDEP